MILEVKALLKAIDWVAESRGEMSTYTFTEKYVANRVLVEDRVYRTWRLVDHSPEKHAVCTLLALIDSDPKANEQALEA